MILLNSIVTKTHSSAEPFDNWYSIRGRLGIIHTLVTHLCLKNIKLASNCGDAVSIAVCTLYYNKTRHTGNIQLIG